ncbi:MAG TPA: GDSL-type esterase/lipase family protein [Sphingobium sp.]|uniref:GDSL-type esterase/lipase family protein n=1 Tax=Sphingobium sp. TaxID=1912891 RepID=UPI002ED0652E
MTRPTYPPLLAALTVLLLGASALHAEAPRGPKPDPVFPFSREIDDFAKADDAGPAIADATLFLGSSSIRLWDIRNSFPAIGTINRGFGGATTPDVLHYYKRLKPRIAPRSIVVYVGENDLAGGATPDKVASDILTLLRLLRADYPRARIVWMSIKPTPLRWTLWPQMAAINRAVAGRADMAGFDYLEVWQGLLARDGLPDASLFRPDGLHMNAKGYALWTRQVEAWLGAQAKPAARIAAIPAKSGSVTQAPVSRPLTDETPVRRELHPSTSAP